VTRHQPNKETIVIIKLIGSQRPRIKYFSKWAHFLHMLVDFSKSLSYVTRCMHPLQMNSFSSIFGSYPPPRDTKTGECKGINQISREAHTNSLEAITC
jgi:hypothetical protein